MDCDEEVFKRTRCVYWLRFLNIEKTARCPMVPQDQRTGHFESSMGLSIGAQRRV